MPRRSLFLTMFLALYINFSFGSPGAEAGGDGKIAVKLGAIQLDSIAAIKKGETLFVGVVGLACLAGASVNESGGTIECFWAGRRISFRQGSPFCSLNDGSVLQLVIPIEPSEGDYLMELTGAIRLLNDLLSNRISFDSSKSEITIEPVAAEANEDRKRWALDLVVIDAGHGGKDPGAIGPTGLKEKDVTLDVALRLNQILSKRGVKTVLTRENDKFIALSDRTGIANKSGGKLFISLHCNSAKQRKAQGLETYFLAPSKTERATEVALMENESIRFEDRQDRYQELTEESYILMTMTQATFTQESESLAGLVQETVSRRVGLKNRGVDQAGFYVLIGASMPSILFEMAFISNKEEEKKLKDKKFRQRLAEEIGDSILEFLASQPSIQGK